MTAALSTEQIAALEEHLEQRIAEFRDNDWGAHDYRPWVIGHALSMASGQSALDSLKAAVPL
jgi:hypothetical protein